MFQMYQRHDMQCNDDAETMHLPTLVYVVSRACIAKKPSTNADEDYRHNASTKA